MKLEFVKSERTQKELNGKVYQNISLTYNLGKRPVEWTISIGSALKLLKVHDEKWEDYLAHADEKWSVDVDLFGNGNIFTLTRTRIQVFHHYLDEVKAFIKDNYTPRELITAPMVEIVEDDITGDYVRTLFLPCFEKSDYEEGEGLVPLKLTDKQAKYLFDVSSVSGINIGDIKAHYASDKKDQVLVKHCVARDGREYDTRMSPEQVKCIIKYKNQISNFKDNLDLNF